MAGETEPDDREVVSEEDAERAAARHAGLVAARRLSAARGIEEPPPPGPGASPDPAALVAGAEPPETAAPVHAEPPETAAPVHAEPHEGAGPAGDERAEPLGRVVAIERELREVDAALDRIDDSLALLDAEDYGSCSVCQAEIPAEELAADPYLRTCSVHRAASGPA